MPETATRTPDQHGNVLAREGCDRCECGSKYWEKDVCHSCGAPFRPLRRYCSICGEREGSSYADHCCTEDSMLEE